MTSDGGKLPQDLSELERSRGKIYTMFLQEHFLTIVYVQLYKYNEVYET